MEIKIITTQRASKEYIRLENKIIKTIDKFAKIKLIDLKDYYKAVGLSAQQSLEKLENDIIKNLDSSYLIISVSVQSECINDEQFDDIIQKSKERSNGKIIFIIFDNDRISDKIIKRSDLYISLIKLKQSPIIQKLVLLNQLEKTIKKIYK